MELRTARFHHSIPIVYDSVHNGAGFYLMGRFVESMTRDRLTFLSMLRAPAAVLLALALVLAAAQAGAQRFEQGLLWRVEGAGSAASHVFGTIHVDDPRVTELPPAVARALNESRSVTVEVSLDRPNVMALATRMIFQDGRDLAGIAGTELFGKTTAITAKQCFKKSGEKMAEHVTTTQAGAVCRLALIGFYATLKELPVPTLAVVQGAAYGFGCALAGGCDVALAGEGSRFRLPEMTKGLPPTLAMAALDRLAAKGLGYLVYSAAEVDARSALAMGLVSAVVPDGELEARSARLIETVASQPLDAVKAVKEYLKFAPQMEPRGRADFAASIIAGVLSSR